MGAFSPIANKTPLPSRHCRSTLEILNKPEQSSEQLSAVGEEQNVLQELTDVIADSLVSTESEDSQLTSFFPSQSAGLKLATSSPSSLNMQLGCSLDLGNCLYTESVDCRLPGLAQTGKDQISRDQSRSSYYGIHTVKAVSLSQRAFATDHICPSPAPSPNCSHSAENHDLHQFNPCVDHRVLFGNLGTDTMPTQPGSSKQKMRQLQAASVPMNQAPESLNSSYNSSLSQQYQLFLGHMKSLPEVFDSFQPALGAKTTHVQSDSQMNLGTSRNACQSQLLHAVTGSQITSDRGIKHNTSSQVNPTFMSEMKELAKVLVQRRSSAVQSFDNAMIGSLKVSAPLQVQEQLKSSFGHNQRSVSPQLQLQEVRRLSSEEFSQYMSAQDQSGQQTGVSSEHLSRSQMSGSLSHSDVNGLPPPEPEIMVHMKQVETKKKPPIYKVKPGGMNNSKMKGKVSQHTAYPYDGLISSNASKGIQRQTSAPKGSLKNRQVHLQGQDNVPLIDSQLQNEVVNGILGAASCVRPRGKGEAQSQFHAEVNPSLLNGGKKSRRLLACQAADFYENLNALERERVSGLQQFVGKIPDCFLHGASRLPASSIDTPLEHIIQQHFLPAFKYGFGARIATLPKKRRKLVSPPVPWHVAITHPGGQLFSASDYELLWAAATNHLPKKDDREEDSDGESTTSATRAKMRLNLTTQLMQQLVHPLPPRLMRGNTAIAHECAIYTLSKLALGDACRLVVGSVKELKFVTQSILKPHGSSTGCKYSKEPPIKKLVEGFMEVTKQLDTELVRLEGSTSASELKCKIYELETISIVNRLGKHHGKGFCLGSSERSTVEKASPYSGLGLRRPFPQKYVTAVPMPKTLPQAVTCLPL